MLKIIHGKAGSGKTTLCFEQAKTYIKAYTNVLFVVPESYSLSMEKRIVAAFGAGFSPAIDVLTFERLPSQVYSRYGPVGAAGIDKISKQMLIQKLLLKNQKKLNILSNNAQNLDFAASLLDLFDEFAQYLIAPETLKSTHILTQLKLEDIKTLYHQYQREIAPFTLNLPARLDFLCSIGENPFHNTNIFLDQFTGFTPEEMEVIRRFFRMSAGVTLTLTADSLSAAAPHDKFAESKLTAVKIQTLAQSENVPVEIEHITGNERRLSNENITVSTSLNPYDEVKFIAEEIIEQNYTPSDVSIIANNSRLYGGLIAQIFPTYGLDCFVDLADSALKSPQVQSVLAFLDVYKTDFSTRSIIKYLKSSYAEILEDDLDLLENYSLAAGITRKNWLGDKPLTFTPRNFTEEDVTSLNRIIAEQMQEFKEKKLSGRKKISEIIAMIYGKNEVVDAVLSQMQEVFADEYITFEKFISILKSGLKNKNLTALPEYCEQAHFCAIERFKGHTPKVLFILGVSEGEFPKRHISQGVLSDSERDEMSKNGVFLAPTAKQKQFSEQQTVYMCLHSPTEKLYLCHSLCAFDGSKLPPSPLLKNFQNCVIKDNIYNRPPYQKPYRRKPDTLKISKQAQNLYSLSTQTSVSKSEAFQRCPYAYFLRFGLCAKTRQITAVSPPDIGSILHECIEKYSQHSNDLEQIIDETLTRYFSETVLNKPRFISTRRKLRQILQVALRSISDFYKQTDFVNLANELEIPELTIPLKNGREIKLIGRADRVDILRTPNGNFINLVDYKTYDIKLSEKELAAGLSLQLPIYIKAICDSYSRQDKIAYIPANMLYFQIDAPLSEIEDNWEDIQKQLRMRGFCYDETTAEKFMMKTSKKPLNDIKEAIDTAYEKLGTLLNRLYDGEITATPYSTSGDFTCRRCDFATICRYYSAD